MSCVFPIVLLACGDSGRETRVVPREDSSAPVLPNEQPDGSVPQEEPQCVVNQAFVDARKACSTDADCALLSYQTSCC
ncbi:MAG TPA: hypothetical protein VMF89_06335, partial [Polyangiales bacterium]|nr:hypothetical protein [Polyangiales bacterium]